MIILMHQAAAGLRADLWLGRPFLAPAAPACRPHSARLAGWLRRAASGQPYLSQDVSSLTQTDMQGLDTSLLGA